MNKEVAIYEFIDRYAYFACAACIAIENYAMTDADDDYRRLVSDFTEYLQYYDSLREIFDKGKIGEKEFDSFINSYLEFSRQNNMNKFINTLQECVNNAIGLENELSKIDVKQIYKRIQKEAQKKKSYTGFDTSEIRILLDEIRKEEERRANEF